MMWTMGIGAVVQMPTVSSSLDEFLDQDVVAVLRGTSSPRLGLAGSARCARRRSIPRAAV
jgi:hypothetical protein